jgi:quinoprotein glucose dehydrogenase
MRSSPARLLVPSSLLLLALAGSVHAQHGAANGEWRYYGGDAGNTKYSPLDQIDAKNVKELEIVWRWKADNFGPAPDYNWEVTPLMVGKVLYFTAGSRRDVVAVDAATGETLWMYRLDEGERGDRAPRKQNRGLAYWTDGKDDARLLLISPGYQLVALDARTGRPVPTFGKNGVVELTEGLDRDVVKPGQIGASSPAIVVRDVVVVGAAMIAGTAPPSKTHVPGYIRGFDVHTGRRIWTFKTIPRPGETGNETWEGDSWQYTGNTGAWAPLAGDEELGYVYVPVEMPTGDFYGGHRLGNNLFGDSLVCLDAKTGARVWHFQLVHHDVWDWEPSSPPILADITVGGKPIKAVAQVTKHAFTFVFDRATGAPVWPIEERPVPQTDVPGERTSPTQPFPTKPVPYDRQGVTTDDLIDFTPELKAEAIAIFNQYKTSPNPFLPPIVAGTDGKLASLWLPHHTGGGNWPGGAFDPETGIMYVSSVTNADAVALQKGDPKRTDMAYVAVLGAHPGAPAGAVQIAAPPVAGESAGRPSFGPRGLPLVRPPWGRITAIDLHTGDHVWMIANGDAPDVVKNNPALKGLNLDLSKSGKPERSPLLVTKTLLFGADGAGLFSSGPGAGGRMFRAIDKKTGAIVHEMALPASTTGIPMTYMVDDRQYIVVAVGARGVPAELIALAVP